jgi:bifunctional non-homologous end joining protein LigD
MLATLAEVADLNGMLYEIKWDGYRAIAMCNKTQTQLLSRNQKSFEQRFFPVYTALSQWNINVIVDGEIIAMNEKGKSSFSTLQNWRKETDGELLYYVFDIMWWEGYDLSGVVLTERRKLLQKLIPTAIPTIRFSETIEGNAHELIKVIHNMGMEGIMAKKSDSLYYPGLRTREWLKMKAGNRHEVVIGGYTQNEGTSKTFSSLLVGVYKNKKLHYMGKVGTGFSVRTQQEILDKMKPLVRKTNPFAEPIDVNKPSRFRPGPLHAKVTWLKPELVAEVRYTELTNDGIMRHPSFEGLREDKKATQVMEEKRISVLKQKKN